MPQSHCDTCGAPLPGPDLPCRYCAAGLPGAISLTGMATAMSDNAQLESQALPLLAAELHDALPGRVTVEHGGMLGAGKRIKHLAVSLDDAVYTIDVKALRRPQQSAGSSGCIRHRAAAPPWTTTRLIRRHP
jgi:hypothetical protein